MCGIVGYTGARQAAPILLEGLQKLEYRGYDSAGLAVVGQSAIEMCKVTGRIANLCEKTENGAALPGTTGIGHTRWATHGAPTDTNAHPHLSNDGKFAVVHNGIIENYLLLREELMAKGYHFESETDTEVIVHLLEMYYDGNVKKAVIRTSSRLHGSYALGVVCTDCPDTVYVAREASPLILGLGLGENFFASDVTALVNHTRNVIYMEDGDFAALSPEGVSLFDCTGQPVRRESGRITWDVQSAEKGGYAHFMFKEMIEQPRAVKATLSPRIHGNEIVIEELPQGLLDGLTKIVITACGSAYYAGCAGRYAIEQLTGLPVQVELASELRYSEPFMDKTTLLIVLSQSGETADTIAAMRECARRGARTLAIVNVVGSTIAKLADAALYTWAGPEIAVATTKGYTTQVSLLCLLALYMGNRMGKVTAERSHALLDSLRQLPKRIQEALDLNPNLPRLAKKYHQSPSIFFIGRNTDYAAALEGALKMKEISYLHAEAYAAGELKHGTIALIEDRQLVIALCCNPKLLDKTVSNMIEVKTRGARVLALTQRGNKSISATADDILYVPKTETLFSAAVEIIPLQMLAYYVAKENGCDIDKPKNLAKSVTVE